MRRDLREGEKGRSSPLIPLWTEGSWEDIYLP